MVKLKLTEAVSLFLLETSPLDRRLSPTLPRPTIYSWITISVSVLHIWQGRTSCKQTNETTNKSGVYVSHVRSAVMTSDGSPTCESPNERAVGRTDTVLFSHLPSAEQREKQPWLAPAVTFSIIRDQLLATRHSVHKQQPLQIYNTRWFESATIVFRFLVEGGLRGGGGNDPEAVCNLLSVLERVL